LFEEIKGLESYIEAASALGRVRDNRKLYKTLLLSFLRDPGVEPLVQAVRAGEIEEAAGLAHKLKGVAANLSLTALYRAVVNIEARLKAGFLPGQSELEFFLSEFEATVKYIEELNNVLE
jgi:HPt (histidine-containing phosphotransfer) domain-containing protein